MHKEKLDPDSDLFSLIPRLVMGHQLTSTVRPYDTMWCLLSILLRSCPAAPFDGLRRMALPMRPLLLRDHTGIMWQATVSSDPELAKMSFLWASALGGAGPTLLCTSTPRCICNGTGIKRTEIRLLLIAGALPGNKTQQHATTRTYPRPLPCSSTR